MSFVATKGSIKLSEEDGASTQFVFEGSLNEVNEAIGKVRFLADCSNPEQAFVFLAVGLKAWGKLDKSTVNS